MDASLRCAMIFRPTNVAQLPWGWTLFSGIRVRYIILNCRLVIAYIFFCKLSWYDSTVSVWLCRFWPLNAWNSSRSSHQAIWWPSEFMNFLFTQGRAGRWKHEHYDKNSGKRLCLKGAHRDFSTTSHSAQFHTQVKPQHRRFILVKLQRSTFAASIQKQLPKVTAD